MSRGRPVGGAILEKDLILQAAFELLRENSHKELSLRKLAEKLEVTPMALYRHFTDKEALINALSDQIYQTTIDEGSRLKGSASSQLKNLLLIYYESVVALPALTSLIFSTATPFSDRLQELNTQILHLLKSSRLSSQKIELWRDILVDLTHGHALATAAAASANGKSTQAMKGHFEKQLKELIGSIY